MKNNIKFCRISNAWILYYTRGCTVHDMSPVLPFIFIVFFKCTASICYLRSATAHVHILVPQSHSSIPRAEIMRRKISCLHQPQIGEMKICLKQRERPPWRLGLRFLSHIFLGGFMWQNTESCFVPLLVTLHPLPIVFFFSPFLLSGCLCCQPIAWHLLSCS